MGKETVELGLKLQNSQKNANTGKTGSFNQLKSVEKKVEADGTVVLNFFSRKQSSPGQVVRFCADDWKEFQNFIFPVATEFSGKLSMSHIAREDDDVRVGIDEDSNPSIVFKRRDCTVRLSWETFIEWFGKAKRGRGRPRKEVK